MEFSVDYAFTDIAAQRFGAGVRVGDRVDKDMIVVSIAPDLYMAVVASPGYLSGKRLPAAPHDLTQHRCINLRLPTHGGLYAWELEKDGQPVKIRGRPRHAHIECRRLMPILEGWWPKFPGYHFYYANRRQLSPALAQVIGALRLRPVPHGT